MDWYAWKSAYDFQLSYQKNNWPVYGLKCDIDPTCNLFQYPPVIEIRSLQQAIV